MSPSPVLREITMTKRLHDAAMLRPRLARWREFFFAQKYRFELGQSFLVVANFTLLTITACGASAISWIGS